MSEGKNMTEAEEFEALQALLVKKFIAACQEPPPKASMLAAAARFLSEARAQGAVPPKVPPIDTSRLPFPEGEEKAAVAKAKPADAKPAKSLADVARGLPFATVTPRSA